VSVNAGAGSGGAREQDTISVPQIRRTTARLRANQLENFISGLLRYRRCALSAPVSCAWPSLTDRRASQQRRREPLRKSARARACVGYQLAGAFQRISGSPLAHIAFTLIDHDS